MAAYARPGEDLRADSVGAAGLTSGEPKAAKAPFDADRLPSGHVIRLCFLALIALAWIGILVLAF